MANLTIAIDDELLKRARVRAAEEGTSVNAVLRKHLEQYAQVHEERRRAIDDLLQLSRERAKLGVKPSPRRWRREDAYDRHGR